MFSRSKLNPELTFYVMSGAMTLFDSTMFVYLTVFLYTVVGLNPLQLVLVGTVLEGSILLFEVPTGVIADTTSRRLSILLGVLTLGASFILMSLARTFPLVLVAQVIMGLGYTFLSGATDAWLADEVGQERVGAIYLRSGQINRLIGMVGIGLSALLASVRLDLPLLTGGILYLCLAGFLAVAMPENHFQPFKPEAGTRGLASLAATFREGAHIIRVRPFLITLVLVNFFIGMTSEGFDRLGDAHLVANFQFPVLGALKPVVWFSIFALAGSLISLLVVERLRPALERLTHDFTRTARVLVVLNLAIGIAGLGFALAKSFWVVVVCLLLRGLIGSVIWPLFCAYQVQATPARLRATVLSMTGQGNALGQVLGGPLVGWIGTGSMRAALSVAALFNLPIAYLYSRKIEPQTTGLDSPLPEEAAILPEGD
jgi:MFS transporter, DHA3 family, tetracycline resistance protein